MNAPKTLLIASLLAVSGLAFIHLWLPGAMWLSVLYVGVVFAGCFLIPLSISNLLTPRPQDIHLSINELAQDSGESVWVVESSLLYHVIFVILSVFVGLWLLSLAQDVSALAGSKQYAPKLVTLLLGGFLCVFPLAVTLYKYKQVIIVDPQKQQIQVHDQGLLREKTTFFQFSTISEIRLDCHPLTGYHGYSIVSHSFYISLILKSGKRIYLFHKALYPGCFSYVVMKQRLEQLYRLMTRQESPRPHTSL